MRERQKECVFSEQVLCVYLCVAESLTSEAGSLTSHCDPDSKCSPKRRGGGQAIQRKSEIKTEEPGKGKKDRRETGREGETNYENPTAEG